MYTNLHTSRSRQQNSLGVIHNTYTKNQVFDPPPPVHMGWTPSPLWTSTRGRHEIHTALLKWLVQLPTRPKAENRLYDSNLFKLKYIPDLKLKFDYMILIYLN